MKKPAPGLLDFLKGVYFFQDLATEELERLLAVCHEARFDLGQLIFEEGSEASRFYLVMEGSVEVWKDFTLPEKDLLAVHGPGHLFGEMALIDDLPRSATVLAREPVHLAYINREDFHRIINENAKIALSIMKSVSSMVRKSNESFVESLRERNRELERTYQALKEAQEELLRRERLSALGKFATLILHDIRNPLSILKGLSEIIVQNAREPAKVERYARKISQETDQLTLMANELLDFSRGEIRLNISIVNMREFLDRFLESIREKMKTRMVQVETSVGFDGPVLMDDQRMMRVFLNMADNARKAMPEGGAFRVRASRSEGTLKIEFQDTGVGMEPEVQKHIFDPFYTNSAEGGVGLGMCIVKSIVQAHDGKILVKSSPGEGTAFTLILPGMDA